MGTIIISLATRSIQLPPFGFVDLLPPGNYKWYHYCRDNGLTRKAPDANYVGERHPETEWPHGKGTLTDQNGDKREGTWENGKPLEVTVTYAADGVVKRLLFEGGKKRGEWGEIRDGDRRYEGFVNRWGHPEGYGTCYYADGSQYEGEYKLGLKHGHGIYSCADGTFYDGGWKDDGFHGMGTSYHAEVDSAYEGMHRYDQRNGFGKMVFAGGLSWKGNWLNNVRHGVGLEETENGNGPSRAVKFEDGRRVEYTGEYEPPPARSEKELDAEEDERMRCLRPQGYYYRTTTE